MKVSVAARLALQSVSLLLALAAGAGAWADPAPSTATRPAYGVMYTAWINAGDPVATVRIRLTRKGDWVRWIRLAVPEGRYSDFKGSGSIVREGHEVLWRPGAGKAVKAPWLQYRVNLESRRESGRYDGRVTSQWALFRGDDLAPVVRIDMEDGTQSQSKLSLNLPEGWSAATPFPRYASGRFKVDNPRRIFDRPSGWILLGRIGVRRETIGGTRLSVAAPLGEGMHRMDTLAFLRWTLPTLQDVFPDFPARLLVVGAGDPMWRGALSGPGSLFVHTDRPLISENGTSTYLHELVHVAMRARSRPGSDWIVEGLAEYYSLEALRRSGALSVARYEKAHATLAAWGASAPSLEIDRASGAVTAKAVGVLRGIDAEIRRSSGGKNSLDDVAARLAATDAPVTRELFDALVAKARGGAL
jgi:hypothetical protein